MTRRSRRRDQAGIALPSPVAALSLAAVVAAGGAFLVTDGPEAEPVTAQPVTATPSPMPTPTLEPAPETEKPKPRPRDQVRRGEVYVEVYNNSGISGLAGSTAERLSGAGWQVVGSDNWYGTIPASTVYYPDRLRTEARLLAKDLGVKRLKPAISPMRFDRLTVILTADFS